MANLSMKAGPKGHQGLLQFSEVEGQWQMISVNRLVRELPPQFSILVCGKTGIGKSSLINFILGKDVCEVGDPGAFGGSLNAQTMDVTGYSIKTNGVQLRIFDSPGLQDGTGNDEQYLADIYTKCRDVDLVFYCHDMPSARWTDHEVNAVHLLTTKFGPAFWDKVVFVLTKANMVQPAKPMTETETKDHFKNWADNSEKCFRDELKKQLQAIPAGEHASSDCQRTTESDTIQKRVKEIPAVPTGSEAVQILPNGKHFIGNLWVSCIERITDPYLTEVFMQATNVQERLVTHEEVERKGHLFGITLEGLVHAGSTMTGVVKEILQDIADTVTTRQHADRELTPQDPSTQPSRQLSTNTTKQTASKVEPSVTPVPQPSKQSPCEQSTPQPSEQPPTLPTPEPPKEPFEEPPKESPKEPLKEPSKEPSEESLEESSKEESSKEESSKEESSKEPSEDPPTKYLIAVDDELAKRLADDMLKKQLQEAAVYTAGGVTGGAAIGAVVGSIVPGIGTAIGAGVGAGVGAVFGGGISWLKNRLWSEDSSN